MAVTTTTDAGPAAVLSAGIAAVAATGVGFENELQSGTPESSDSGSEIDKIVDKDIFLSPLLNAESRGLACSRSDYSEYDDCQQMANYLHRIFRARSAGSRPGVAYLVDGLDVVWRIARADPI